LLAKIVKEAAEKHNIAFVRCQEAPGVLVFFSVNMQIDLYYSLLSSFFYL
jgi:hypothetical protein